MFSFLLFVSGAPFCTRFVFSYLLDGDEHCAAIEIVVGMPYMLMASSVRAWLMNWEQIDDSQFDVYPPMVHLYGIVNNWVLSLDISFLVCTSCRPSTQSTRDRHRQSVFSILDTMYGVRCTCTFAVLFRLRRLNAAFVMAIGMCLNRIDCVFFPSFFHYQHSSNECTFRLALNERMPIHYN